MGHSSLCVHVRQFIACASSETGYFGHGHGEDSLSTTTKNRGRISASRWCSRGRRYHLLLTLAHSAHLELTRSSEGCGKSGVEGVAVEGKLHSNFGFLCRQEGPKKAGPKCFAHYTQSILSAKAVSLDRLILFARRLGSLPS